MEEMLRKMAGGQLFGKVKRKQCFGIECGHTAKGGAGGTHTHTRARLAAEGAKCGAQSGSPRAASQVCDLIRREGEFQPRELPDNGPH